MYNMRKYLLHVLIISFVFILTHTAQVASYAGDIEIETYKQEVEKNPDDAQAHYNLGLTYLKLDMSKEAIKSFKKAIRIDPNLTEAYYCLSTSYGKLGMYKERIELWKQVTRIYPDDAVAHYNLGNCYGESGMNKEAIESCKQAIEIDPDFADAHYNLGLSSFYLNDKATALKQYEILKSLDSELANKLSNYIRRNPDAMAHYNLGNAYGDSGKYQEAIESYKQALRIDPDYADAHFNLGYTYRKLGKYQEAIESYKQALRIDPGYADAHFNLGYAYRKLGKYQEALEQYKFLKNLDSKLANELFDMLPPAFSQGKEKIQYNLRSSYRDLSVSQAQSISHIAIRNTKLFGFWVYSTIKHNYEPKTISGDRVVIDNATGLMWHQPGSSDRIKWNEAKGWIEDINSRGYAGYSDWRLPTVEEGASLLEPNKKNGHLYIDHAFNNKIRSDRIWIWTGDEYGSDALWSVDFFYGGIDWGDIESSCSVRPVRSMK